MSISTKLHNGKVEFSLVKVDEKDILVCTKSVGSNKVLYVENISTGNRVVAPSSQDIYKGKDLDDVVQSLAKDA
ncbi:hypothetical protein ACFFGV_19670 [Pontibacillus salicampi]|uniref:Uncharacterized protein n=1 Tax=Pontibacillus salicampi TaxID=1449801 RepID=A0ABV6LTR8_9BACI